LYLAQNGIKQHLTQKNYSKFEKLMKKQIRILQKQNNWTEYYE